MGVEYTLVNQTKKETISFYQLEGAKIGELCRGHAQSALTTWYLLHNQGDEIQFVDDCSDDWKFSTGSKKDMLDYVDKTNELIDTLIENNILKDFGFSYVDEDDPTIFVRDLRSTRFSYEKY